MPGLSPAPLAKPDIVIPDAGPLIHLAQAGLLHLLHEAGAAVVVVDMVAHEITNGLSKPGAATALQLWLRDGQIPGIIRNQSMDADIDVLTTRAFLKAMGARDGSADRYWDQVTATGAVPNPRVQSFSQCRR